MAEQETTDSGFVMVDKISISNWNGQFFNIRNCRTIHLKSDFISILGNKSRLLTSEQMYLKILIFVTLYFEANFTITPEEVTKRKLPL